MIINLILRGMEFGIVLASGVVSGPADGETQDNLSEGLRFSGHCRWCVNRFSVRNVFRLS